MTEHRMPNLWFDLETFSERPIKDGSYRYAEACEVMLWAWADGDGDVKVWDLVNGTLNYADEFSGSWVEDRVAAGSLLPPLELARLIENPDYLVWAHNGGMFDFPVIDRQLPHIARCIAPERRRDTMVQAFSHAMPGALDKLGDVLNITEDKRKIKEGKKLVHLFCMPQSDAFFEKHGARRATKQTHPAEWQRFIEYAGGDIVTMREAHRLLPMWNYKGKQVDLCLLDWKINGRGFTVDKELAEAAVRCSEESRARLSRKTVEATEGAVTNATQRDALLAHILGIYGVDLPDMRADTLERRMADEDLPEPVRELLSLRLQASMNSAAKFKTVLRSVCDDGRLRGGAQFRGAGRTGRWAHRMFQHGNILRQTLPHSVIDACVDAIKTADAEVLDLMTGNVPLAIGNTVRGAIVAPPGKKLIVCDLSNIEGRMAAWLAGEEWKLKAFRDFDHGIGHDLYIVAYAKSFNVDPATIGKKSPERQIGKVEELMFQYGGGVGAWLTGAATYGIDLDAMTEAVYPTLPEWAIKESQDFLEWLYKGIDEKLSKALKKLAVEEADGPDAPDFAPMPTAEQWAAECAAEQAALTEKWKADKLKARHGLAERTFVACDAIKRLWRQAHPAISSYWKELEDAVRRAINEPGVTLTCRRLKVRRDGGWLRIGLPSGRALCYPSPKIEADGAITYTGLNQYTRQWGRVKTYGGKLFENVTQAASCDQFAECMPFAEAEGYAAVAHVHDELICEVPDSPEFTHQRLAEPMCSNLGWNEGLPLAAAGFETYRYRKE